MLSRRKRAGPQVTLPPAPFIDEEDKAPDSDVTPPEIARPAAPLGPKAALMPEFVLTACSGPHFEFCNNKQGLCLSRGSHLKSPGLCGQGAQGASREALGKLFVPVYLSFCTDTQGKGNTSLSPS